MDGAGRFLLGPYAGTRMVDWALEYAQRGWHVFQMRQGSKNFFGNCAACNPRSDSYDKDAHADGTESCGVHPTGYARCHGLWSATQNLDVIQQWWTEYPHGNIGINCGRSGIALVDIDIKHHLGKTGDQSIAALEAKYEPFPLGPRGVTASGGGHWVFTLPDDHELRSSTGYTDAKGSKHGLADFVDIKAVGGLMVAAPSLIFDDQKGIVTGQYTWETGGEPVIPDLPRWVTAEIAEREQRDRARPAVALPFGPRPDASTDEVRARVMELADEVATTREGGRNSKLLSMARMAFQYAAAGQIDPNEVAFIFEQAGTACGLTSSEIQHTVGNARAYGMAKPRPWSARFGGPEARELYDRWKGIPTARTEPDVTAERPVPAVDGPTVAAPAEPGDQPGPEPEPDSADEPQALALNTYEERVDAFGINYPDYRTALAAVYDHKPDQMGISELFTRELKGGDHLRWNDEAGKFYSYTEGHWNEDGEKHTAVSRKVDMLGKRVTLLVDNDIIDLKARIKGLAKGTVEPRDGLARDEEIKILEDTAKARPAWYKTYRSAGGRAGIIEFIKTTVVPVSGEQMDADPHLLNFRNGTYDVRTGELKDFDPEDYITHLVGCDLRPELAEQPLEEVAPLFARVMSRACGADDEVSDETRAQRIEALKRGIGSTLHGSNPEKKMLVLKGASNTGKTIVMNVVKAVLGKQLSTESRPNLLIRTRNDRHESEEYKLKGRRLVLINELESKMSMDEGQVLRLVNPSGSTFTVRKLREQQQDINVTWSLVVTTNELLKARVTPQVLNRLALYCLSGISVPPKEIDPTLFDRILKDEAEAVLAHAVLWWSQWYRTMDQKGTGLIITDEMREALSGYEEDNSTLADQFKDEMVLFGPDYATAQIRVNDIWSRYTAWHQHYHPNEDLKYGVNRRQFYAEVLTWPGVKGVYKKNGTRPDGTPKQTLIAFEGLGVLIAPHGDPAVT